MHKWLNEAVFYEIYPQSFQDSNHDGIGDFQGIIRRLDYICELGCNAIWLNPCFDSPFGDAGYDISDYCKTAPRYGTNAQLKQLFDEAHRRGMHVLLDLVPGHTSVKHPWFLESMKAEKNPYTDRYIWTNCIWEGTDGVGSVTGCIRGISDRDGSCAVNFFSHQPALNYGFAKPDRDWQQPVDGEGPMATRSAMKDVMRFWLDLGCDGFRVDMAGSLVKNDPGSVQTIRLWQDFRRFLDKEYPNAVMISEWGEPDKSLEGGFHMDFLLHFGPSHYNDLFRCAHPYFSRKGDGDISAFAQRYMECYKKTGGKGLICIPSGNHDMDRLRRYLDEEEMKIAFAFLLSMPGAPFIYYGDEIAMRHVEGLTSVEGGYMRTGARTPMQWDDSKNAGFSQSDTLYIRQDEDENRPTVQKAQADPESLYHEMKKLIEIRHAHRALQASGRIEMVYAEKNSYPFAYRRSCERERILAVFNPSGKTEQMPYEGEMAELLYSLNGTPELKEGVLKMLPNSAVFIREA